MYEKKTIRLGWSKKVLKLTTNKVAGAVNLARTERTEKFISLKIKTMNEKVLGQLLEMPYSSSIPCSKTRKRNDKNEDHR